jgi:uncharacterized membrane protein AbrB (regulator of aidB expression)
VPEEPKKGEGRLARIFGRAMYVLYVVAGVAIIRPNIKSPAAWMVGSVAFAIILRLTTRELSGVAKAVGEAARAIKGRT